MQDSIVLHLFCMGGAMLSHRILTPAVLLIVEIIFLQQGIAPVLQPALAPVLVPEGDGGTVRNS